MDGLDKMAMPNEDPSVTLTIRLIMQGKEVGSIIGKKGEIVKRFREESGAKINISDGSCPERIVTVTGPTNAIFKAFTLICKKFEEFQEMQGGPNGSGIPRPPITLRLIVPASQCGSLIGKGGSKIKEIREVTGASIQVASEMLPNSTERAVTISGTSEAITQCIYHICCVMLESPPKGATIPYRPKPQVAGPVIVAGGQAYTIQGNYAVPAHGDVSTMQPSPHHPMFGGHGVPPLGLPPSPLLHSIGMQGGDAMMKSQCLQAMTPAHLMADARLSVVYGGGDLNFFQKMGLGNAPLAGLAALGLTGLNAGNTAGLNPAAALAALAGSQLRSNIQNRNQPGNQQTHEMTVPNELIGCIIGKGGTKIAEIRQISGAMIRISNCEEREGGATDRTITITGNPDAVALAQYLINMSVDMQKTSLEFQNVGRLGPVCPANSPGGLPTPAASFPFASAHPLAQSFSQVSSYNRLQFNPCFGGLSPQQPHKQTLPPFLHPLALGPTDRLVLGPEHSYIRGQGSAIDNHTDIKANRFSPY